MGGPCNFAFRNTKGEVLFCAAYTAGMTWMSQHPGIFSHDDDFIPANVKECNYSKYRSKGLFPGGYGLTVIDYITDTIFTHQGYSFLKKIYQYDLVANLDDRLILTKKLCDMNKIRDFDVEKISGHYAEVDKGLVNFKTEKEFLKFCKNELEPPGCLVMDHDPIKVIRYSEDNAGFDQMRLDLIKVGFEIHEKKWKEQYSEEEEEYEDQA